MSTSRNRRIVVAGTVLATGLGLASCTIPTDHRVKEETTVAQTNPRESVGPKPTRGAEPDRDAGRRGPRPTGEETADGAPIGRAKLDAIVREVAAQFGAQVGVVLGSGAGSVKAGALQGGAEPAWSTIKVPLAIAALRSGGGDSSAAARAIQSSDNAAAEQLWASLGGGAGAADQVAAVIREYSGQEVAVQPTVTRPGFSAFGQTRWTLAQQADFAAGLAEAAGQDPAAGEVYRLMGQIMPGHAYGIGQLPGAAFKGGWGPDESGGYLVRQFGVAPARALTDGGAGGGGYSAADAVVPIAIAVRAADGSYETGQQVLNAIVQKLKAGV